MSKCKLLISVENITVMYHQNCRGNENAEPANVEDKKKMRKEKGKIRQKAYRDRILASRYCDE